MITFITETDARDLIESEVESNSWRGIIQNPTGFSNHCIGTARIGYATALKIIDNHPSLARIINPEIIRVQGYMHDFSKIYEGNTYHEVGTAYLVLTQGDTKLKLVSGTSEQEKTYALKEMASLILPDYALFEGLGGNNFPDGALWPKDLAKFRDRIGALRVALSNTEFPLSIEELAVPSTINQLIAQYADLTNIEGVKVSVQERLTELQERYRNPGSGCFNPSYAEITDIIRPRLIVGAETIEQLLQ